MLIDFTVENFRSFRDRHTFEMVAAPRDRQHEDTHVFEAPDGTRLLRTALIYGANASGKTNLIAGLNVLAATVLAGRQFDEDTELMGFEPFRLTAETREAASAFEVTFVADGIVYEYALSGTRSRITSERLSYFPEGNERKLFTRTGDTIRLIGDLKQPTAKVAQQIGERRSNTPFLSLLGQNEEPIAIEAYRWFKDRVGFLSSLRVSDKITQRLLADDPAAAVFIRDLLRLADTGVERVDSRREAMDLPDDVRRVATAMEAAGFKMNTEAETYRTEFRHMADPSIAFDEDDESSGTRHLFRLAGPLYSVFENGQTLLLDELDSSLHPDIVRALIDLFNRPEFNRNGAQLIANTHDATQLDLRRLRRDNVWITEKGRDGASRLTSLADIEGVRVDTALEKNYLQGRFGGLPAHGLDLLTLTDA